MDWKHSIFCLFLSQVALLRMHAILQAAHGFIAQGKVYNMTFNNQFAT